MSIRDRKFELRNGLLPYAKRAQTEEAIIQYAIDAYGFLLKPQREYTGKQFAREVKRQYSLENPRNRAVYQALKHSDAIFIRRRW